MSNLSGEIIGNFDELFVNGDKYIHITNNNQLVNGADYITSGDIPSAPSFPSTLGSSGQIVRLKSTPSNGFEYTNFPVAASNNLGGVKVGTNLSIDGNGILSATIPSAPAFPTLGTAGQIVRLKSTPSNGFEYTNFPVAASNNLGGVKVGTNLSIDGNGILSATIPKATTSVLGGVIVGSNLSVTTAGVLSGTANTEYSEGDGIQISNSNAISLNLDGYSQSAKIKLTSSTEDVILAVTSSQNDKFIKLNNGNDTRLTIANDVNTSSRLQVEYDGSEVDYNVDTVNLLVKSETVNTGRDSIISIRGARNGSTTHKVAELRFENNDTQGTVTGVRTLGSICGMVSNSGTNVGDLKFYTYANGVAPTETLKLASNQNATFSSSCRATNFKFNDDDGNEQNVRDLYNNALTSIPLASSSVLGGIKLGYTENGRYFPVELNNTNLAFVNVPDTTIPIASASVLGGVKISGGNLRINSSTGLLDVLIPTANNNTLGGVKIDGNNMEISITGVIGAIVEPLQSLLHVGIYNLQDSENLATAVDTKIRWEPAITNGTSGLLHNATNNLPQGSLFTCNDSDGGVYNLNVQLALTDGTNQSRSFHVIELRTYINSSNHTSYGTTSRIYFIGSGYARMLAGTNKCIYGGSIQITMAQNDQFEIVSTRKYITNSNALNLNTGSEATRLTIDRVLITNNT